MLACYMLLTKCLPTVIAVIPGTVSVVNMTVLDYDVPTSCDHWRITYVVYGGLSLMTTPTTRTCSCSVSRPVVSPKSAYRVFKTWTT